MRGLRIGIWLAFKRQIPRRRKLRSQRLLSLIELGLAIGAVNYVGGLFFFRVDLTTDKRHTLRDVTRQTIEQLAAPLHMKSYLGGELPLEFARLRQGVEEMLEEYRVASNHRISFAHESPHAQKDAELRVAYQKQLADRGILPLSVQERKRDGSHSEMLVFPGLTLSYMGHTESISIYTDNVTRSSEENINASLASLEYAITSAIARLLETARPLVAFIKGHGELEEWQVADWKESLARDFTVQSIQFPTKIGDLNPYKFVILAGPKERFSESEKLILDQYIMQGGQLVLMVSPVYVSLDSLQRGGHSLAYPNDLNLNDMLFRYGVRIPPTLVQDLRCALVPINTALAGQPARFTPMPWLYYPLLTPSEESPISRNVNLVYSRFPGAIELTGSESGPKKHIFLTSSRRSRALSTPRLVSMQEIQHDPRNERFTMSSIPVGVLLEGRFPSVFRHRPARTISGGQDFTLLEESVPTKIVVIADGQMAANDMTRQGNTMIPLPLGFDKYTQQTFGNREILENLTLYLNGKEELLALRGRKLTIGRLRADAVRDERMLWQVLNITLPSLLLLLLGLCIAARRWWHYGRME